MQRPLTLFALLLLPCSTAQERAQPVREPAPASLEALTNRVAALERQLEAQSFANQSLSKQIDDLMWHQRTGDVATVDHVRYTSLPPRVTPNPTGQGAGNPMTISAYVFLPKNVDRTKRHPLIMLVHGGVHSNFGSDSAHIVRE